MLFIRIFAISQALTFTSPSYVTRGSNRGSASFLEASPSEDVAAAPPEAEILEAAPKTTFTSPTFYVYIEDTDAYGVMYNGNYLRSYERALSHVSREKEDNDADDSFGATAGRWILSYITNQKFRSSPVLGEEFVIRGELINNGDANNNDVEEDVEVWQLEMVTRNKNQDLDADKNTSWIVHNSATATLTHSSTIKEWVKTPLLSTEISNLGKMVEYSYTPYNDEFDMHPSRHDNPKSGYHIPIRSALNFFERSRTTHLGGPDVLRKMQVEDDILWVVTGVDDGELLLDSNIALEHDDDDDDDGGQVSLLEEDNALFFNNDWHPTPGREVTVQTNFIVKRRGMILDCQHRLFMDVELDNGKRMNRRLLAQATVTIMALKGSTRRPTSKLPQWVLDRFV